MIIIVILLMLAGTKITRVVLAVFQKGGSISHINLI